MLQQPPLDAEGQVEPHDADDILDAHRLVRRIDPSQHVVQDDNRDCRRVSSKAFQPSSAAKGGMSVDLFEMISSAGLQPAEYVTTPKYIGSVVMDAGTARTASLRVGFDPREDNPFHGEIWGSSRPNRFSRAQQSALMTASKWLVPIDGVELIAV